MRIRGKCNPSSTNRIGFEIGLINARGPFRSWICGRMLPTQVDHVDFVLAPPRKPKLGVWIPILQCAWKAPMSVSRRISYSVVVNAVP